MKAVWWNNVKIIVTQKKTGIDETDIEACFFCVCGKITEVVRVCLKNAFSHPPQAIWNEFWLRYYERSEQ